MIIVIEGTDCSGKATQSEMLYQKLKANNYKVYKTSFPNYDSPTGKIVGGPYLGKDYISEGYFKEGAASVDAFVASLYFAADRKYNIEDIINKLNEGYIVILDRYTYSNMAHQAGKIDDKQERLDMYKWLHNLEFDLLKLPEANIKVFLHMPYDYSNKLKQNREEKPDQHEKEEQHLIKAEQAYLELVDLYNFDLISCINNNEVRTIESINEELFNLIVNKIKTV
jgi:dTMP kinase